MVINGEVEGNVYSTRHLELAAKAQVKGNVFYTPWKWPRGRGQW